MTHGHALDQQASPADCSQPKLPSPDSRGASCCTTIFDAVSAHAGGKLGDCEAIGFSTSVDLTESRTFRQLHDHASQIAKRLLMHAEPGDRALLVFSVGIEFAEVLLACLYAGIVAIPANQCERSFTLHGLQGVLADSNPQLVLYGSDLSDVLQNSLAACDAAAAKFCMEELPDSAVETLPRVMPSDVALIEYTSGSTAEAKGVVLTHANIAARARASMMRHLLSSQTVFASYPTSAAAWTGELLQANFVGCTSLAFAPRLVAEQPGHWLETFSSRATVISTMSSAAMEVCIRDVDEEAKSRLDLSRWYLLQAGQPIGSELRERFASAFAACGFQKHQLLPQYGMVEATHSIADVPAQTQPRILTVDPAALAKNRVAISKCGIQLVGCGAGVADLEVRVVDPDRQTECYANEVGELWIRGDQVASGYWNRPEQTKAQFEQALDGHGDGWLRTDDLGFVRDGELFVTGARADVIVIDQACIYPQHLEEFAPDAFSWLTTNDHLVCLAEPDDPSGIVLLVECGPPRGLAGDAGEQEERLDRGALGRMIDQFADDIQCLFEVNLVEVVFVAPGSLPRTAQGKLRRALARRQWQRQQLDAVVTVRIDG